jgi:RNA polymerase sigma-70 factor (ECF subfamily)
MGSESESPDASVVPGGLDQSVALARDANSEDLGRLLEEFRPYLLAIANAELPRGLAGKLGPSDLVQMTLAKGHGRFAGFRGSTPEELARWLRQILHNHLKTVARAFAREKRNVTREQPADSSLVHPRQLSPSAEALSREEREVLNIALKQLPDLYREAIELRHAGNLTFQELGERLGRSEEAARKVWARAVRQLQEELGIDVARQPRPESRPA